MFQKDIKSPDIVRTRLAFQSLRLKTPPGSLTKLISAIERVPQRLNRTNRKAPTAKHLDALYREAIKPLRTRLHDVGVEVGRETQFPD